MGKRERFNVGHNQDRGGWDVKKAGAERASSHHDTKAEAVEQAKKQAKAAPLGQVVIQKKDGTIQTEHTYGKDPYPPPG